MLKSIAASVSADGINRVKPSVYFNPIAQPISHRPATNRVTQARLDGIAASYRCGAFGRVSMVPNAVMPTAHSTIGTTAVQGRPVRSQNAPQITGVITPMV